MNDTNGHENISDISKQPNSKPEYMEQPAIHRMNARELLWVGLGGIIGAGFFLGSGLPISYTGPGVIFSYLLGGLLISHIAGALTSLSVNYPVEGSFKVYAEKLIGPFMGYYVGWTFWISAVLTIGSEVLAMAIFSRLWLPNVPQWLLTLIFSSIVILLNALGLKSFGKIEAAMSFVKVFALILFIAIGIGAIFGVFSTTKPVGIQTLLSNGIFPRGFTGFCQSMLLVIFSYAGIAVIAMASSEAQNPKKDIPRAMLWLVVILIALYVISISVVLCLIPWGSASDKTSPFVMALNVVNIPFAASIMNAVILVAAFSVMVGTYFSAIIMLASLGNAKQAPEFVTKKSQKGVYYNGVIITAVGLGIIIFASYILPSKIYDYIISASAYFSFVSLSIILVCFLKWRNKIDKSKIYKSPLAFGAPWTTVITLGIIAVLFIYSLAIKEQRIGFYFALLFSVLISIRYSYIKKKVKNDI